MENKPAEVKRSHNLHLEKNQKLTMSGVVSVPVFNERTIEVVLSENVLTVLGDNLNIETLNLESGSLVATGKIRELKYSHAREKLSFIKRIFK